MFCTVYVFFFSIVLFVFVCLRDKEEEEECSYCHVPSGSEQSQIDKQDAFRYFLSIQSFVPLLAFRRCCWLVHDSSCSAEVISR